MSPIEKFRAHVYGTDMSSVCEEADVVKMIIEMLLGSTNDIFGNVQKPLDKVIIPEEPSNSGDVRIQVFHITPFGSHTLVDKLSSSVLQGILKWFAQFGSHMFVCRKFALYTHNHASHTSHTELTSAVLDTLRSSVSDLLSAVEESLCDFEQKVLDLPLSENQALQHSALECKPRITLIALYQRCLSWQGLFQSLAGLVCSAMPSSAITALTQPTPLPLTTTTNPHSNTITNTTNIINSNTTTSSSIETVFEKLTVRGVLQEMGEMLRLGGLVDTHPSMGLLSGGIKSTRSKSGYTAFDVYYGMSSGSKYTSIDTVTSNTANTSCGDSTDVGLTFSLTCLHRSEYYMYSKLLYSAMLEKYLTNLVSMVWATNTATSTNYTKAGAGTSSSNSVYSAHTTYDTPMRTNPNTPNNNRTHPNTPGSANKNHLASKTHRDVTAIDDVLLSSGAGRGRYGGGYGGGDSVTSTLANRQKQRQVVSLLHHARQLVALAPQYEVPTVLDPITLEATVSARDVLILQKSHVQRQSPSYNLSSLKALIRESVLEYQRALLPHHHSVSSHDTTATNSASGTTTTTTTTTTATTHPTISARDALDPVVSYLLTGRSVKIVGVRTVVATPPRGVLRGSDGGGVLNKENTIHSVSNNKADTTSASKATNVTTNATTSLTLASYNGGGVTTNTDYLSTILSSRNTLFSCASAIVVRNSNSSGVAGGVDASSSSIVSGGVITDDSASTSSSDTKQSLIDKVSRVALHRTTTTSTPRTPHSIPTSELVHYTTATTKLHVSLLHRLKAQLHTARADSAKYVLHTHALHCHLHYLRDVFFLGIPDFYAPIRELCLNLTEWKSSVLKGGSTTTSSVYRNSTTFIGEAIAGTMLEKAPVEGIRHLSVVVSSGSSGTGGGTGGTGGVRGANSVAVGINNISVVSLEDKLTAYLVDMSSTSTTNTINTTNTADIRAADSDVTDLFSIITTMNIDILHHYPLTHFIDTTLYTTLNSNMRFLLLLTASRWTAEYWWMDVISNHSLNTTSYTTSNTSGTTSAPPSPTKLSSPMGHGAIYGSGGASANDNTYSNPMRTHSNTSNTNTYSIPTTPTKSSTTNTAHYLADVLQAKRNCRAGLAIWLHTITAINNVFMAHIHRTLWPAFETSLSVHSTSLLHMQYEFHSVLHECDASLLLLREHVLGIIIKGFSATTSMRAAVVLEYSEIAVVEAQTKQLAAIHDKIHKLSPTKNNSNTTNTTKEVKKVSRNPRVEMRNVPKVNTETNTSNKMHYKTSAAVLVAYRTAEDAFNDLKLAVGELKYTVEKEVRRSSGRGSVGREVRAMEELLMYLST